MKNKLEIKENLPAPPGCSPYPSNPRHPRSTFRTRSNVLTLFTLLTLCPCGCSGPHPLRGGRALTSGPVHQSLAQSDNPYAASRQDQQTIRTRTYTLPAGTFIQQPTDRGPIPSCSSHPTPATLSRSNAPTLLTLSAPVAVTEREETRARTELGAAQKDTARELGAKLSSLKGIVWVGVLLFLFGLASLFWPPLKAIIGSVTTSAAITLGGVALMILPTLIVGNELLILGGVTVAIGAWFLAHRHGLLRGQLNATSKSKPKPSPTK